MGEVYLTELEMEILSIFVLRKILKSKDIIQTLKLLSEKVRESNTEGDYDGVVPKI